MARFAIAAGLLFVAATGVLRALTGVEPQLWLALLPGCLFRAWTGIDCPGCGMTRAFLLLGELRVVDAWHAHPASLPLAAGFVLFALGLRWRPSGAVRDVLAASALVAVLGLWALRTLGV